MREDVATFFPVRVEYINGSFMRGRIERPIHSRLRHGSGVFRISQRGPPTHPSPSIPPLPPSSPPSPSSPSTHLPSQVRSQDCQNEEADRLAPLPCPPIPYPPLPCPPLPLEVGPSNPARGSGDRCKLPSGVWGGAPAEIDIGAF